MDGSSPFRPGASGSWLYRPVCSCTFFRGCIISRSPEVHYLGVRYFRERRSCGRAQRWRWCKDRRPGRAGVRRRPDCRRRRGDVCMYVRMRPHGARAAAVAAAAGERAKNRLRFTVKCHLLQLSPWATGVLFLFSQYVELVTLMQTCSVRWCRFVQLVFKLTEN